MNLFKYLSILCLCTLFLFSCKDKQVIEDFSVEFGYEYFPLEVGKYVVYQVDSVVYNIKSEGTIDSASFFIKEEITDTLLDNENRVNYRIERSVRNTPNDPWVIKDIWVSVRTDNTAERVEENVRFVKMVFPLEAGSTWDGNQFVDKTTIISVAGETLEFFKGWEASEIGTFAEPETINGVFFEEVTTIIHAENENLIEIREVIEKYAKNVGLVYKKMRILDTQCDGDLAGCDGLPWEEKAEEGFILEYRVVDFN